MPWGPLDYLYTPSANVAGDLRHFVDVLGGTFGFAIEDAGVRVAMVELGGPPAILLTDHLEADHSSRAGDGVPYRHAGAATAAEGPERRLLAGIPDEWRRS